MAPSCDHERGECVHKSVWPKIGSEPYTLYQLNLTCREYEKTMEDLRVSWEKHQPEIFSENETEYDEEEAENLMNNTPSPQQRMYCYWNPEYEARRQARKRLWSPPITPDPEEPWQPRYSLQPSQRPPSPSRSRRRHQQRSSPHQSPLQSSPNQFELHLPHKAQSKVHKAKKAAHRRRPTTRSTKSFQPISLGHRKGYVLVGSGKGASHTASFEEYTNSLPQEFV
ncbi:MAG: hypothetical protein Q9166_006166 [cf. Caloplaca sp. 2 TL-2023]